MTKYVVIREETNVEIFDEDGRNADTVITYVDMTEIKDNGSCPVCLEDLLLILNDEEALICVKCEIDWSKTHTNDEWAILVAKLL